MQRKEKFPFKKFKDLIFLSFAKRNKAFMFDHLVTQILTQENIMHLIHNCFPVSGQNVKNKFFSIN